MAISVAIAGGPAPRIHKADAYKGDADTLSVDYAGWAEDNEDIDAVTWEATDGGLSIDDEALSSNVASASVSFGQAGRWPIKLTATAGAKTLVTYVDAMVRDPQDDCDPICDYGMLVGGCC